MNFLNILIKILHILVWGSIVALLIKEIIDTREAKKARKVIEDASMDLFFKDLMLITIETLLEEMKKDIHDDVMGYYHSELSKEVKSLRDSLTFTQKQLEEYLE